MYSHRWEEYKYATADERRRFPIAALIIAVLAIGLVAIPLLVIARDGVPHDDDDALLQAPWLELTLVAGLLLLPVVAMCFFGIRPPGKGNHLFTRVPGTRLWLAYVIWLAVAGIAVTFVALLLGLGFTTPRDLRDVDGTREAFGWLFIRAPFFMIGGLTLCGIGLAVAVVARAIITAIHGKRGIAARDEVAAAYYLVGILVLVVLAFAFAVSVVVPGDPTLRFALGLTFAALIVSTVLLLLGIARRAQRKAAATGAANRTQGLASTDMSPEVFAAAGIGLLLLLARAIGNEPSAAARTAEILRACAITTCSASGMTTAGWLIVAVPAILIIVTAALWQRLARLARIAALVVVLAFLGNALLFLPGRNSAVGDLVSGPGSDQVAGGLTSAVVGLGIVLVWWLVARKLRARLPLIGRKSTMVMSAVVLLVAALGMAIWRG